MPKPNQTMLVYEKLKKRIERGEYSPAESLLEAELSSEYGVSRNTIKKALLMLENDDLITMEQNKGAKVRSYSKKEVLDYLELRVELEGFMIRLAVPFFTEEDVRRLEETYRQMEKCRLEQDLMGYSELNQRFHEEIYRACPNKTAVELMLRLKNQMRKYNAKTILIPGRGEDSFREHGAVLEAIRQGDVCAAEMSMRTHIANVRKTFEEYYSLLF